MSARRIVGVAAVAICALAVTGLTSLRLDPDDTNPTIEVVPAGPLTFDPPAAAARLDEPATVAVGADRIDNQWAPRSDTGYESLFIGHSFFRPVAERFGALMGDTDFPDHEQTVVFSGGATGAPQALWDNPAKRAEIRAVLDTGDVELFGMTYHPEHPSPDGYRLWIDAAIDRNRSTMIFLGFPWLTEPRSMTAATYASTWRAAYDTLAKPLIDTLRTDYPDLDIFVIPYGRAAAELYLLFEAGELPDVSTLVSSGRDGLFSDEFGHGGRIIRDLAALIWLRAVYDIDPAAPAAAMGYTTDLAAIADRIMDEHDPSYNAP